MAESERTRAWTGPGLALGLLLPVALCGAGLLRPALRPDVLGAAGIALALLPAVVLAAVRGARPALEWSLLLAALAWSLLGTLLQPPDDTFEADRALLLATVGALAFLAGSALDARGRRWLATGLVVTALPTWAFGLGNSGATSEALLPAALVAAAFLVRIRVWLTLWPAVPLLVLLTFLLFVGQTPVIAGAVSFCVALGAAVALTGGGFERGGPRRQTAKLLAGCLFILPVWIVALPDGDAGPEGSPAGAVTAGPARATGGFEVRARIWPRTVAMTLDHPLLGVGAGQFAAAFPPYRDPVEIELSSHGRTLWQETEVEHAHADLLHLAAEGGLVGGALWALFLVLVAGRALRALRGDDAVRAAFGAALVGLLVNGLFRAPVAVDPVSSYTALALAGALGAAAPDRAPDRAPGRARGRALPLLALPLFALLVPTARDLVRHELALRGSFERARDPGSDPHDPVGRRAAEAALRARPDSVLARTHLARLDELANAPPEALVERWEDVLALRPHRVEALVQVGFHRLAAGRPAEARRAWERALELDPLRPGTRRNLARLAAEEGRTDDVEALDPTPEERAELGIAAALAGHPDLAAALRAPTDERWRDLAADPAYAWYGRELDAGNEALAWAFKAYAHQRWGREQAEAGAFDAAVRSLRQAAQAGARGRGRRAPALELELAAALVRAGRADEARAGLDGAGARAVDLATLPDWAGQALLETGLLPR